MCGFAGIGRGSSRPIAQTTLARMAQAIRHRGPDDTDTYLDGRVGLAHVRLGTFDITGAPQPLTNGDGSVVIAYDGDIYNYRDLRRELAHPVADERDEHRGCLGERDCLECGSHLGLDRRPLLHDRMSPLAQRLGG